MAKQFQPVDCSRGSPMGRAEWCEPPTKPHSVRVFRVRLDSGGYDDGGAYWGLESRGALLFCATNDENYRMFCRAESRLQALLEFRLSRHLLKAGAPEMSRLRELESRGVIGAQGVILRQRLEELGY